MSYVPNLGDWNSHEAAAGALVANSGELTQGHIDRLDTMMRTGPEPARTGAALVMGHADNRLITTGQRNEARSICRCLG